MELNKQLRRRLRLEGRLFIVLLLAACALLGWLSSRYVVQLDWTAAGRHTLSEPSRALLERMQGPVTVTAFAREQGEMRGRIRTLIERYRQHKPDIALEFIDPDRDPQRLRELNIRFDGELLIEHRGRHEQLQRIGEASFSNALLRLSRGGARKLCFLAGHGERRADGQANHDLGLWLEGLAPRGISAEAVNPTERMLGGQSPLPEGCSALVIASPRHPLLPGETAIIGDWVEGGGNLLWLAEPDGPQGMGPLAERLGLELLHGTVVDATTRQLGIEHPAVAVIVHYPEHLVSASLHDTLTLFPFAAALRHTPNGWHAVPLLRTLEGSWVERGKLEGELRLDENEIGGPLDIGWLLSRHPPHAHVEGEERHEQRIAVIGDGDFLSNAYLGNQSNQALGDALVEWLAHDDELISLPRREAADPRLEMSPWRRGLIGFGFLIILPLGLLIAGGLIWYRRRGR